MECRLGSTASCAGKGSPALGGDTAEVLGQWLGIDAGKVAKLRTEGVLGAEPGESEKLRAAGG